MPFINKFLVTFDFLQRVDSSVDNSIANDEHNDNKDEDILCNSDGDEDVISFTIS